MGASCLSGKKTQQYLDKSQSKIDRPANFNPICENPESLLETPKKKSVLCPSTAISTSGIASSENTQAKSASEDIFASPLNNQSAIELEDDLDIWVESQNTRSSIIRLPSKIQKKEHSPNNLHKDKEVLEDLKNCQTFEGELKTERLTATMTISNEDLEIQFILPRCRAGPIVVPYLDYEKYASTE